METSKEALSSAGPWQNYLGAHYQKVEGEAGTLDVILQGSIISQADIIFTSPSGQQTIAVVINGIELTLNRLFPNGRWCELPKDDPLVKEYRIVIATHGPEVLSNLSSIWRHMLTPYLSQKQGYDNISRT